MSERPEIINSFPKMFRGEDQGGRETNYIVHKNRGYDQRTKQPIYVADQRKVGKDFVWRSLLVSTAMQEEKRVLNTSYALGTQNYAKELDASEIEKVCSKDENIKAAWEKAQRVTVTFLD